MDTEIIILSKVSQRKKNNVLYHFYVESSKNDTNELTYKTETDFETYGYQRWKGENKLGGWVDMYTLLYLK